MGRRWGNKAENSGFQRIQFRRRIQFYGLVLRPSFSAQKIRQAKTKGVVARTRNVPMKAQQSTLGFFELMRNRELGICINPPTLISGKAPPIAEKHPDRR